MTTLNTHRPANVTSPFPFSLLCLFLIIIVAITIVTSYYCYTREQHTRTLVSLNKLKALKEVIQRSHIQTTLSTNPTILFLPNFLSAKDCQHLISLSEQIGLSRSTVQGKSHEISDYRTSYTTSLQRRHDDVVHNIEKRVSHLTGFPLSHIENLQVVRYQPGQQYKHHYDFFIPNAVGTEGALQNGGQRYLTFFVYLNDLPTPIQSKKESTQHLHGYTDFPKLSLKIQPQQGAAVFWMNVDPETGQEDYRTYHAGMPPLEGTKYGLNVWIRAQPFQG